MTKKINRDFIFLLSVLIVAFLVWVIIVWCLSYYVDKREKEFLAVEFRKEFGQPADTSGLDPLAKKNRELVIWEKIRNTASTMLDNEEITKSTRCCIDVDRDPNNRARILSGRISNENKERLITQLKLAWKLGEFEDANQTQAYGFLFLMAFKSGPPEPDWNNILKEIKKLQPK